MVSKSFSYLIQLNKGFQTYSTPFYLHNYLFLLIILVLLVLLVLLVFLVLVLVLTLVSYWSCSWSWPYFLDVRESNTFEVTRAILIKKCRKIIIKIISNSPNDCSRKCIAYEFIKTFHLGRDGKKDFFIALYFTFLYKKPIYIPFSEKF